ncbi:hypothetical protein [Desertivirga xinjiangensis]|uniref:hypothetical protein n=1 Tax=Desertivirga xinjiangensis TaxID=539206 RepID=UPI00210C3BD6|nr:hypothetical protein [Pedobacter xinjiangensis]
MKKSFKISFKYHSLTIHKVTMYALLVCLPILSSCSKDELLDGRSDVILVTETTEKTGVLTQLAMPLEGGKDTLYIHSGLEFNVAFETDDKEEWIKVESLEQLPGTGTSRLILSIAPLQGSYNLRSGMLSVSNKSKYLGHFVRLSQGYTARFAETFSWLKYGTFDPFDASREVAIQSWSTAQKQYGWTSTADGGGLAYAFGRNEHVKLGSDLAGADLISPRIGGIVKDSILLLTFNAVAQVSRAGEKDLNKLTVSITEGGDFVSGGRSAVVEAVYLDHQSSMADTKMWDNSLHVLYIKKPDIDPNASTIKIRFNTGGDGQSAASNRIFIDNVNIHVVHQFGEGNILIR